MPVYENEIYIKLIRPVPETWPTDVYGIPFIKKSNIDISDINNGKWLIGLNNANSKDKNKLKKIVHSFKNDDEINRFYNKPYFMLERLCPYYCVATFDFSMDKKMKKAQIIDATFKNRWSGAWLQMNGQERVIVTVGWVEEDTYDICFAGIEDGTTLLISTLGIIKDGDYNLFIKGYKEMRKRFPSSQIICVGNRLECMDDDICYVSYKDSFGNRDNYHEKWQYHFLNWELKEVE